MKNGLKKPDPVRKVSALIPMHNMKSYIAQCVESILDQTMPVSEIILVDNGSDDGSGKMADEMAAAHPCLHVIHTENRGVSAARNTAIAASSGDLLLPVDADDWLEPDCLETLLALREQYPGYLPACNHRIEEARRSYPAFSTDGQTRVLSREQALRGMLYHDVPDVSCWGKLWDRRLFDTVRYPEGHIYEDTWTAASLVLKTSGVVWTPKIGYHYRIRPDSISRSVWGEDKMDFPMAVEELCGAAVTAFPGLRAAADRRRCHAWLSLRRYFVCCAPEMRSRRDEIEKQALRYRHAVMTNPEAPRRDKIALAALSFGPRCFDLLWKLHSGRGL